MGKSHFMAKSGQRILSFVLALCMMVGLAPVSQATTADAHGVDAYEDYFASQNGQVAFDPQTDLGDDAEVPSYWYNFYVVSPYLRGEGERHQSFQMSGANSYETVQGFVTAIGDPAVTSADWCYYGQKDGGNFMFANEDYGVLLSGTTPWGAVKIDVPTAGTYQLVSSMRMYNDQGDVDVYLAPAADVEGGENAMDAKYLVATVDTYRDATAGVVQSELQSLGEKELEAGEYILTYSVNGNSSGEVAKPIAGVKSFGLIPPEEPVETVEARDMHYDFNKAFDAAQLTNDYTKTISYDMTTADAPGELNKDIVTDPWAYFSGTSDASQLFRYVGMGNGLCIYPRTSWGMVKFKVLADGEYTPVITTLSTTDMGKIRVRMSKLVGGEAGTTVAYPADELDTSIADTFELTDEPIALTAGEYVLRYEVTNGGSNGNKQYCYLKSLDLKLKSDEPATMTVTADKETVYVAEGNTTTLPLTVSMSDGSPVDYSALSYSATYGTENIATVTGVQASDAASVQIEGVSAGTTTVQLSVTSGAVTGVFNFNVTVTADTQDARSFYYNMLKGANDEPFNDQNAYDHVKTITYDMTTVGGSSELNVGVDSDPWAYLTRNPLDTAAGGNSYVKYNEKGYGIAMYSRDSSVTVKVQVPEGTWRPYVTPKVFANGGKFKAEFGRIADGAMGEVLATTDVIDPNAYASGATPEIPIGYKSFDLTEGEYAFRFTLTEKGSSATAVNGFGLKEVLNPELTVTADSSAVSVGEDAYATLPLTLLMSDDSTPAYSDVTYDVEYGTEGVAEVSGIESDSEAAVRIKGLKEGSTTVKLTVTAGAASSTIDFTVTVPKSEPGDLYFDMIKGASEEPYNTQNAYDHVKTITYDMTTAGSATELNKDIESDPWAYVTRNPVETAAPGNTYIKYNGKAYGIGVAGANSSVTIKVKVNADGTYRPFVYPHMYSQAAYVKAEFGRLGDGAMGEVLASTEEINPSDYQTGTMQEVAIGDTALNLTKGEYAFRFTTTKKGDDGKNLTGIVDAFALKLLTEAELTVTAESSSVNVEMGKDATLPLTLSMSDGSQIDYQNLVYSAVCDPADVATVTGIKEADKASVQISGLKEGTTNVALTVTNGETSGVVNFTVNVMPEGGVPYPEVKDLYFNLNKANIGNTDTTYFDQNDITYDKMWMGSPTELNKYTAGATYRNYSDPWAVLSTEVANGGYVRYPSNDYGIALYKPGAKLNVKVMVSAGTYQPLADLYFLSGFGDIKVTFSKLTPEGTIGEKLAESAVYELGNVKQAGAVTVPVGDKVLDLEKGEYVFTVERLSGDTLLGAIDALRLNQVKVRPEAPAPINVGEEAEVYAFNGGTGVAYAAEELTATPEDAEIATVTADPATGKLTVSGLKAGTTSITVNATGTVSGTYTFPVTVVDPAVPNDQTIYYDFKKANSYDATNVDLQTVTHYNQTIPGVTEEINTESDYGDMFVAPWTYYTQQGSIRPQNMIQYREASRGITMIASGTGVINYAIKLRVPFAGEYQISSINDIGAGLSSSASVKLAKLTDNQATQDLITLGTLNCTNEETQYDVETKFDGTFQLDAGEYIVIYGLPISQSIVVDGLKLTPVGMDVSATAPSSAIDVDETVEVPLTISMRDGTDVDYDSMTIDVSYSIPGVVEATPVIDKEGKTAKLQIKGVNGGATAVTATVKTSAGEKSVSFSVTVAGGGSDVPTPEGKSYYYNMLKVYTDASIHSDYYYITKIKYANTTAGDPEEINPRNPDGNSGAESDPWEYLAHNPSELSGNTYIKYNTNNYGLALHTQGNSISIKVKVDQDGFYRPVVKPYFTNGNAYVRASLYTYDSQANAAGELLAQSADINTSSANMYGGVNIPMGDKALELKAGEYVFKFEVLSQGSNKLGILEGFYLNEVKVRPEVTHAIVTGESVVVPAFTGGMSVTQASDSLTATADQDGIVSIQADAATGNLTITGEKAGTANITVTAEGPISGSYTFPVTVVDADNEGNQTYLFDFTKTNNNTGVKTYANELEFYNYSVEGTDDERNVGHEVEDGVKLAPWKYLTWEGTINTPNSYTRYNAPGEGLTMAGQVRFFYKINVPETGAYQIIPIMRHFNGGCDNTEISIAELRSDGLPNTFTVLGSVNTNSDQTEVVSEPLPGIVNLEAGEYVLKFNNVYGGVCTSNGVMLKALEYKINTSKAAVKTGGSTTLELDITNSAGVKQDMTGAVVTATVADEEIAEVTSVIEDGVIKLQINGLTTGNTKIDLDVTKDGKMGAGSVSVNVNPAGVIVADDLRFDYHKLDYYYAGTGDMHTGYPINQVTSFNMTTAGDPEEINPESSIKTEPWYLESYSATHLRYADTNYGLFFAYEPGSATFKIRVKEDGLYRAVSEHMVWPSGAILKLWLAPDGAEDPTADEYYLGEIDTYSAAQLTATQKELKVVDLTKGDYTLTYKMDGKNEAVTTSGQVGFGAFILKGMDSETIIDATAQAPEMIKKGEVTSFTIDAKESDGLTSWEKAHEISFRSSVDGIVEAEAVPTDESKTQYTVNLTGLAAGNTILTIHITMGTVEKDITVPLTVYDPDQIADRDYIYLIKNSVPNGMKIAEVTSFSMTMQGSPDELMPGTNESDLWCFYDSECSDFYNVSNSTYGPVMGVGVGAWAAIKIRLPVSGYFTPILPYYAGEQLGVITTYIAPADAEDPMADQYSVGTFDAYSANRGYVDQPLRSLYMTPGDYIVTWKIVDVNPACTEQQKPRLWFSGLELKKIDSYPDLTITTSEVKPIKQGNSAIVTLTATSADGAPEDLVSAEIVAQARDEGAAEVKLVESADKSVKQLEIIGLEVGDTVIDGSIIMNGDQRATFEIPITVLEPGVLDKAELVLPGDFDNIILIRDTFDNSQQLEVKMTDTDGDEISALSAELQGATYEFSSSDTSLATVSDEGVVTPVGPGQVTIYVTVTIKGVTKSTSLTLTISEGKTRSSFYTEEKVAAARENAEIYDWAISAKDTAVANANKYVDLTDTLWKSVTTQELPRSYYVGYRGDPNVNYCRYCGANIAAKYGDAYAWITDPLTRPWKVQCPDCRRVFPSNDFEKFYELGIDEHGNWDYELAKQKNAELVEAGEPGYLVNELYPEKDQELGITGWGVDDGYGYDTGNIFSNGCKEVHTYISFYNHWGIWHDGLLSTATNALRDAYLYTGDAKYGRVGAILIDRIADVYPDMDTAPYRPFLTADSSYAPHGKVLDLIWENQYARLWSEAYDAFFPMYDDEYVQSYLENKATVYKMDNPKTSGNLIRENCEDGILREIFRSAQNGNLNGNFGMTQSAVAYAAVVLDTMPETREMIDWVFQNGQQIGSPQANEVTGGNVNRQLITSVDRDGISDEIAPNYADIWIGGMVNLVNALAGYDGYPEMDMYNNPRFIKMLKGMIPLTMSRRSTVQIGDSGATADSSRYVNSSRMLPAFQNTQDPVFAQMLYFINGNDTKNLHYDIFTKDPQSLQDDVREVINTYGEYDFDKSEMLGGYGISMLRGGSKYKSANGYYDDQRTFWMSYTRSSGHQHRDALNLGIESFGLNIAPELGYPEATTGDSYGNWGQTTVSHNTVVVNDLPQDKQTEDTGDPMHFDDSGMVKVMDADASNRYGSTSQYRRTVVTVDADDSVSYAVDFFRVLGGDEHVYSFHALSDEIA